jgi:HEAT repeat protein
MRRAFYAQALAFLAFASHAEAMPTVTAPAGGGVGALTVSVDLTQGVVVANDQKIAIDLDRSLFPDERDVVVESVAIGGGRHVVHVRLPAKGANEAPRFLGWEAILAAGEKEPLFAGTTGLAKGEEGERTGTAVRLFPRDDGGRDVVVGNIHEDTRICGEEATLLSPRGISAKRMAFAGASVQRLPQKRMDAATRLMAHPKRAPADVPLAHLLVGTGTSVPSDDGGLLTDGDVSTFWHHEERAGERAGASRGEFVVMSAPHDVPIARLAVVVTPPSPPPDGSSPKSFFLVADAATYLVTLPENAWAHPGDAYEIALPAPLKTSCLALVLDESFGADASHPEVGVAELYAYSTLDAPGATLEKVAAALSDPQQFDAAVGLLSRAGSHSLAAVTSVYPKLDARGRAAAIDIGSANAPCEALAPLLVRGLDDPDEHVMQKAEAKLERCGKRVAPGLAKIVVGDASSRLRAAPLLALLDPQGALDPLARVMGDGGQEVRAAVREAFAIAARVAPTAALSALLADATRTPVARLDLVRASSARLPEIAADANAAVAQLVASDAGMRTRYLVIEPLAVLAHAGDADALGRLVGLLSHDAAWQVRAHAAEGLVHLATATDALVVATHDANERVRGAAALALARDDAAKISAPLMELASHDTWSFVRSDALSSLATLPPAPAVDAAVGAALEDASPRVRAAAAEVLGLRHAIAWSKQLRKRVESVDEDIDVRLSATTALGRICDGTSLDLLTKLARAAVDPPSDADTQLGAAAIDALAAIHPADLAARLAPLSQGSAPKYVAQAARAAIAGRGACR